MMRTKNYMCDGLIHADCPDLLRAMQVVHAHYRVRQYAND